MINPRVMNTLRRTPWHIHGGEAATHALAMAAMDMPAAPPASVRDRYGAEERKPFELRGGVAVIEISGMLVNFEGPDWLMDWMGLCSYASIIRALDAAAGDASVRAVVLACDSPGGMHWGLADADAAVERCKAAKPTVAHTRSLMCSAMYWLASICHGVYAEGQAIVGSIGTIVTMYDYSGAFEKMGIETVAIASHEQKAAGTEGLPIRDEDTIDIQELVSECSGAFVRTVARGRRMDVKDVLKLATGRTWTATPAAELGLTDGVIGIDALIAKLASGGSAHGRA